MNSLIFFAVRASAAFPTNLSIAFGHLEMSPSYPRAFMTEVATSPCISCCLDGPILFGGGCASSAVSTRAGAGDVHLSASLSTAHCWLTLHRAFAVGQLSRDG